MFLAHVNLPLDSSDTMTCFSCGLESSKWNVGEDVWVRHARSSPNCQHLITERGTEFIRQKLDHHGAYAPEIEGNKINVSSNKTTRPL